MYFVDPPYYRGIKHCHVQLPSANPVHWHTGHPLFFCQSQMGFNVNGLTAVKKRIRETNLLVTQRMITVIVVIVILVIHTILYLIYEYPVRMNAQTHTLIW